MSRARYNTELENVEIDLLLEGIHKLHGINLQEYSGAPVRRRVWEAIRRENTRTVSGLQEKLFHDPAALWRFIRSVQPPVDPYNAEFFRKFRQDLVPLLRTYPFIRIWQAGCSSVFETYLLAIILDEEGVYEKSVLYGTDVHECNLQNCVDGVFPLEEVDRFAKIYEASGGRRRFENYITGGGQSAMFDRGLRKNMVFSQHNLATGTSFNEFNAIFCRKPLKIFDPATQERAGNVLYESLVLFGILGLNPGETLRSPQFASRFAELDREHNLYRKIS